MKTRKTPVIERQKLAQRRLVTVSGAADIGIFRFHAVNVGRRYGHAEEQLAAGHTVVALRTLRRHGAFITPEKMHPRPIYLGAKLRGGEKAIELPRG
jgi:hypothetical protein